MLVEFHRPQIVSPSDSVTSTPERSHVQLSGAELVKIACPGNSEGGVVIRRGNESHAISHPTVLGIGLATGTMSVNRSLKRL